MKLIIGKCGEKCDTSVRTHHVPAFHQRRDASLEDPNGANYLSPCALSFNCQLQELFEAEFAVAVIACHQRGDSSLLQSAQEVRNGASIDRFRLGRKAWDAYSMVGSSPQDSADINPVNVAAFV